MDRGRALLELLESAVEHAAMGIVVVDAASGAVILSNAAAARVWGRDVPVGARPRASPVEAPVYPGFHADGRPYAPHEWPVERARLHGETVSGEEIRIARGDGSTGWILATAAPIRAKDGHIQAAVATLLDVTAQKLAEEDARRARRDVESASRAKDDFLAMLGHELRNPLSPIVTALHLMRIRGGSLLEKERAVIERQVSHLTRLVDDLLDVSRALRGLVRLERRPIELASVVSDAMVLSGQLLEERRHSVVVEVPEHGLAVDGDPVRLAQVVTNLLTNAAKYTPGGGHVRVTARRDAGEVVLEVADDGDGIEPELLPRVFDAFTQGRQGLDRKKGGLGLGLAVSRQLVLQHGGSIAAYSGGPGRGTTMTVRLPPVSPAVAEAPPRPESAPTWPGPEVAAPSARRVLVVDDNPDAAEMLSRAMALAGHDARVAADGPTALQVAVSFTPEIAFLDIGLPVMDGYELAQQLRRLPALRSVPLVAVTGYAQQNDRARALASGFDEHLAKPIDLDRALDCVSRLGEHRAGPA